MIQLSQKDFVVAKVGKKRQLIQVQTLDKESWSGINHSAYPTEDGSTPYAEGTYEDVLTNLGQKPQPGTAYGVKVEPLIRVLDHDTVGQVHVWRESMTRAEWELISASIDWCYDKLGSMSLLPARPVEFWIKEKKGRWDGYYKTRNTAKFESDLIVFSPQAIEPKLMNRLITHEFAHHLFYRRMQPKQRANWHQLYTRYCNTENVTIEHLDMLKSWLDSYFEGDLDLCETVKDLANYIDNPALVQALWSATDHINYVAGLSLKELNDMVASRTDFREYFPEHPVEFAGEQEVVITEYARTNSGEFFAEAFSFWVCGYKLPERVLQLLASSFNLSSSQRTKVIFPHDNQIVA